MKKKIFIILSSIFILTGCAIKGGIAQIDNNVYLITEVDMKLGFGPVRTSIINQVYSQANDFCGKQNKIVKRIKSSSKDAAVGSPASYTLEFSCIDE